MESTIFENLKLLYNEALTCQDGNDDQQALHQIESIDGTTQDIDQLQYNMSYNIC